MAKIRINKKNENMKHSLTILFITFLLLSLIGCDESGTTRGIIKTQFPLMLLQSDGDNNNACYIAELEGTEENITWTRSLPSPLELEIDKAGQLALYLHEDNKNVVFSKNEEDGTKSLYVLVMGKRDQKEGDSITIKVENDVATIVE